MSTYQAAGVDFCLLRLQRTEQNFTLSQSLDHLRRQLNGRPQQTQVLEGRKGFLCIRNAALSRLPGFHNFDRVAERILDIDRGSTITMRCQLAILLGMVILDGKMGWVLAGNNDGQVDIVELKHCPGFILVTNFHIKLAAIPVHGLLDIFYLYGNVMNFIHILYFSGKQCRLVYIKLTDNSLPQYR